MPQVIIPATNSSGLPTTGDPDYDKIFDIVMDLLDPAVPMADDFVAEQKRRKEKRLRHQIYDVTAWSLPLVFDVEAVAVTSPVSGQTAPWTPDATPPSASLDEAKVAWLLPWGAGTAAAVAEARTEDLIFLDLETTGLDADQDRILSIGLVEIHGLAIRLDTAWHPVLRVDRAIPEDAAVIHRITDDRAARGEPLAQVLPELLRRLKGRVLLGHHAVIEQRFLTRACKRLYGAPFVIPCIDTEILARRQFDQRNQPYQMKDLRLFNLRSLHGLPRYPAHDALSDALATAELFLALTAGRTASRRCRLRELLAG